MSTSDLEGLRDALGRECRPLVSISENKWRFGGLDFKGLEPFDVNIGAISSNSQPKQRISELILALDNLQFSECQRRKKWTEILKNEKEPTIRLELVKRLMDSEERSFGQVTEIVKLLKGVQSVSTKEGLGGANLDDQLNDLLVS